MTAFDRDLPAVPQIFEPSHQGIRDAARSDRYAKDVAQRHRRRSRLSAVRPEDPSTSSDREFDVTSALTLPS
ncbi:amidohydrolase, partial [Micromonospora aurantiaca]